MYTYDNLQNELSQKFAPKKEYSSRLASCYRSLGFIKKAKRVNFCGSFLGFDYFNDDSVRLVNANFCKDSLCAMCAWRKSLKLSNQVYKCVSSIKDNYKFVFVTLTVKNCSADKLSSTIKLLNKSYTKLMRRKRMGFVKGAFKALEITYNNKDKSFHPHLHAIWVVSKKYFSSDDYLSTSELVKLWKKSLGIDYNPICYVERIRRKNKKKNALSSAVSEVAKYPVKASDFLKFDEKTNNFVVETLSVALTNVKTFQFYGILSDIRKKLSLSDDDDDLIHIDEDKTNNAVLIAHLVFCWNKKTKSYYNCDVFVVDDNGNVINDDITSSVPQNLLC